MKAGTLSIAGIKRNKKFLEKIDEKRKSYG
jgi:hypothetical protein